MSAAYWIAFLTISTIALVPLLTAAVLEAFNESSNDKRVEQGVFRLSYETAKKYSELWANADHERTLYLSEREVVRIIAQLPQPLGTDMTIQDSSDRPASWNPLCGTCFGRRRVLTSTQSSSSLIPAQLGAASALLHSLPIVLDSGRIHFHALLQVGEREDIGLHKSTSVVSRSHCGSAHVTTPGPRRQRVRAAAAGRAHPHYRPGSSGRDPGAGDHAADRCSAAPSGSLEAACEVQVPSTCGASHGARYYRHVGSSCCMGTTTRRP